MKCNACHGGVGNHSVTASPAADIRPAAYGSAVPKVQLQLDYASFTQAHRSFLHLNSIRTLRAKACYCRPQLLLIQFIDSAAECVIMMCTHVLLASELLGE